MTGNDSWKDFAKSAQSLSELRNVLEDRNFEFKKAADERRQLEAMVDHMRIALKQTRKKAHVRQIVLAKTMGTTQSSVSALETGSGDLGMMTVFRYLAGLRIDPATWFKEHALELADEAAGESEPSAELKMSQS